MKRQVNLSWNTDVFGSRRLEKGIRWQMKDVDWFVIALDDRKKCWWRGVGLRLTQELRSSGAHSTVKLASRA